MQRITSAIGTHALHRMAATRRIEAQAARQLPPHTLMRNAGTAVAQLAIALAPHAQRIWIAVGPGNNGGDELEAATLLRQSGKAVTATLFDEGMKRPADAEQR